MESGDEIDIDATVEETLESGIIKPVMRSWFRDQADFFLVLDASSSMEGYKWSLAAAITLAMRGWLSDVYRFRLVLFSDHPLEISLPMGTASAWQKLIQLNCAGVTNLAGAAGFVLSRASSSSWVVFVTDGRANVGRRNVNMPAPAARVDVVLVGDGASSNIRTNGVVVSVREPADIKNILERLAL